MHILDLKRSLAVMFLLPACIAVAQRLPENAAPVRYQLSFTPDLKTATFEGEETIELKLTQAMRSITLNSAEIEIKSAEFQAQAGSVTYEKGKDQATITVSKDVPAGDAKLHIVFHGTLNDQLRGFYLSKSEKRNYAVTQFEATDARRAFPSFDEPAYKAVFDITLVIDKGDNAISNGAVISDTPGPGDAKHTVKFKQTAKMSTYLVAMLVGDFKCVSGSVDNIPLRVCGTPERAHLLDFALEATTHIVNYYKD